jgi:hypothetical protein
MARWCIASGPQKLSTYSRLMPNCSPNSYFLRSCLARRRLMRKCIQTRLPMLPPQGFLHGLNLSGVRACLAALVRRVLRVSGSGMKSHCASAPVPPEQLKLLWTAVTCHRFQSAGMELNPKTEIRTADFTDFTDDKRVPFAARASDSSGRFRLQVLVYPRHPRHPRFQLRQLG